MNINIKPLVLIVRIEEQTDGTHRILSSEPYGNMAWGVGVDFPTYEAAVNVAQCIADNVDGTVRIDG